MNKSMLSTMSPVGRRFQYVADEVAVINAGLFFNFRRMEAIS